MRLLIVEDGGFDSGLGVHLRPTDLDEALEQERAGQLRNPALESRVRVYHSFPQRLKNRLADEGIELDEIPTVRRRWDRENHHLDRYDLVVCDMGFPTSYTPRDDLIFSYLNRQREALRALHSYFLEVEQATGNDRSHGMIDHLNALLAGNWKSLISGWKKYAGFYAVVENVRAHHSSRGYHGTLAHVLLYTSDFRHALFTLPVAVLFGFLTPDEVVHLHEQHRDKTGLYFSLSGRLAVGPKSPLVKSAEEEREVSDWQAFGHWVEVVKKAKEFQVGR